MVGGNADPAPGQPWAVELPVLLQEHDLDLVAHLSGSHFLAWRVGRRTGRPGSPAQGGTLALSRLLARAWVRQGKGLLPAEGCSRQPGGWPGPRAGLSFISGVPEQPSQGSGVRPGDSFPHHVGLKVFTWPRLPGSSPSARVEVEAVRLRAGGWGWGERSILEFSDEVGGYR